MARGHTTSYDTPTTHPLEELVTLLMVRQFDRRALRAARLDAGLTQRTMAELTGIPLDTIRDYEQGRSLPSVDRLPVLVSVLPGVSIDSLFTDADVPETEV